mgnify:CR=1 FL=1
MVFGLYFFRRNNPFDNAFFVNDKSGTEGTHVFASVHAFFSPYTEGLYQLCSVSAISVNGSWFFSMNFWCDFSSLMLTPITS